MIHTDPGTNEQNVPPVQSPITVCELLTHSWRRWIIRDLYCISILVR